MEAARSLRTGEIIWQLSLNIIRDDDLVILLIYLVGISFRFRLFVNFDVPSEGIGILVWRRCQEVVVALWVLGNLNVRMLLSSSKERVIEVEAVLLLLMS